MDGIEMAALCHRQLIVLGVMRNLIYPLNIENIFEQIHIEDDEEALLLQIQKTDITAETDNPAFNAAVNWILRGDVFDGKDAISVLAETMMNLDPAFKKLVDDYLAEKKAE